MTFLDALLAVDRFMPRVRQSNAPSPWIVRVCVPRGPLAITSYRFINGAQRFSPYLTWRANRAVRAELLDA